MMPQLKGGKTAPRILQDIYSYDPRKPPPSHFNVLTQIVFHDDDVPPPPLVGKGSCRHEWALKQNQSLMPDPAKTPDATSIWTVAAYCAVCRSHLDFVLDFREGGVGFEPCGSDDRPLHHFQYLSKESRPRDSDAVPEIKDGSSWIDTQVFRCTSIECTAKLTVRIKPPRLVPDWSKQLTDHLMIKARADKAIEEDPERFEGHTAAQPIDVLNALYAYIENALQEPQLRRKIKRDNKRFRLSLGESCADLLEYIGFSRDGEDWLPPKPELSSRPYTNPVNIRLDDIQKEILVLSHKRPNEEKRMSKFPLIPELAAKCLRSVLGCQEYKQSVRSRTIDLSKQEHPYYAGLGAVEDFHDNLIIFAYHRQIESDPEHAAYYLECFQGIAEGRNSDELQTKAAIEMTSDKISSRDIRNAFKELGLDPRGTYEDETILGTFHSRIADAPKQEDEMRQALKIIGHSRSSEKIQVVASQTVTNYEQALAFLNTTGDVIDDFILSMYTVKVSDRPADEPTARRAVSLIAEHRNSQALRYFLETGSVTEAEMTVDDAYAIFSISEPTIDDETIIASYNVLATDQPAKRYKFRQALMAIGRSRSSWRINHFLGADTTTSNHPPSEWPVGLENIGNTCYLNSLLQCYFTIKPLRDLILDVEKLERPRSEASLRSKRVGGEVVHKRRFDRALRFVEELRNLYKDMIVSPRGTVAPMPELARLTLIKASKEETVRRQSILSPTRPSFGKVNGEMVDTSHDASIPEETKDTEMSDERKPDIEPIDLVNGIENQGEDSASESTLIGDPDNAMDVEEGERTEGRSDFNDKENVPPARSTIDRSEHNETLPALASSPPNQVDLPHGGTKLHVPNGSYLNMGEESEMSETLVTAAPPGRSPPPPPTSKPELRPIETDAVREAEFSAQQEDVTEAISNTLDQLQCALKADSVDENGEQIDQVKKLFYGKQRTYNISEAGKIRYKEDYMAHIMAYVPPGDSLYAALDRAYDKQYVDVDYEGVTKSEPQYATISRLPPILQIMVNRVQFDKQKKMAYKSIDHLELKEVIYMDRYMDDPTLQARREQSWQWKEMLERLKEHRDELATSGMEMEASLVLSKTRELLQSLSDQDRHDLSEDHEASISASSALLESLEVASNEYKKDLQTLDSRITELQVKLLEQFDDLKEIPYRLHSIFIHKGTSAGSGHYIIYIYDFSAKMWRSYNDTYVEEVKDVAEIFGAGPTQRPATSYFLVYVKDGRKDELVDCVCREPTEELPPVGADVEMTDPGDEAQTAKANSYQTLDLSRVNGVVDNEYVRNQVWTTGAGWNNQSTAGANW